jgi:hypothetical protein
MPNNPNANTNLVPFAKGHDDRRNYQGRPRKLVTQLGDFGYTKFEIEETIRIMLALTIAELKEIIANEHTTMLEALIAAALIKDGQTGKLLSVESLFNRLFGRPYAIVNKDDNAPKDTDIIIPGEEVEDANN